MQQIASFSELPKEKRPPEVMWDNAEKLDKWFDKVIRGKTKSTETTTFYIDDDEIEE